MNFIQKIFNISTTNNNPLIPFDEVVAKKMWRYLQHGFVLIGVNDVDCVEKGVIKELQTDIMKKDFRYSIKQRGGMLAKGRLLGIQFLTLFEGMADCKPSFFACIMAFFSKIKF